MNIEHLRMLTPNAIEIGKPGGGHAALTPEDVAGALAGLPQRPYYLGMTIYAADGVAYEKLYWLISIMQEVPQCPEEMELKDPVRGILDLCLDELWGDNKCKDCGGSCKTKDQNEQLIPCVTCRESGRKKYTDLSRANQAGIPYPHWSHYREFYTWLYLQLTEWNDRIDRHVKKRYGDE